MALDTEKIIADLKDMKAKLEEVGAKVTLK